MKSWIQEPLKELMDLIDRDDHQERIIFFEQKADKIKSLDDADRYYCEYQYIQSLYTVERYDDVIDIIDAVIEYVFIYNMDFIPSRTYEHLLYIKTESLYETLRYDKSLEVGKQLLGMHPQDKRYRKLVEKSFHAYLNFKSSAVKLAALLLVFSSSIISAIFWFTKSTEHAQSYSFSFSVVVAPCALAVLIIGGTHFINYLISLRKTELLIRKKMRSKKL